MSWLLLAIALHSAPGAPESKNTAPKGVASSTTAPSRISQIGIAQILGADGIGCAESLSKRIQDSVRVLLLPQAAPPDDPERFTQWLRGQETVSAVLIGAATGRGLALQLWSVRGRRLGALRVATEGEGCPLDRRSARRLIRWMQRRVPSAKREDVARPGLRIEAELSFGVLARRAPAPLDRTGGALWIRATVYPLVDTVLEPFGVHARFLRAFSSSPFVLGMGALTARVGLPGGDVVVFPRAGGFLFEGVDRLAGPQVGVGVRAEITEGFHAVASGSYLIVLSRRLDDRWSQGFFAEGGLSYSFTPTIAVEVAGTFLTFSANEEGSGLSEGALGGRLGLSLRY